MGTLNLADLFVILDKSRLLPAPVSSLPSRPRNTTHIIAMWPAKSMQKIKEGDILASIRRNRVLVIGRETETERSPRLVLQTALMLLRNPG